MYLEFNTEFRSYMKYCVVCINHLMQLSRCTASTQWYASDSRVSELYNILEYFHVSRCISNKYEYSKIYRTCSYIWCVYSTFSSDILSWWILSVGINWNSRRFIIHIILSRTKMFYTLTYSACFLYLFITNDRYYYLLLYKISIYDW